MRNKLGITEGEWTAAPNGNIYRRDYRELYEYGGGLAGDFPVAFTTNGNPSWENKYNREANAKLIADAGTTANKCGLLPSELLKQRYELLAELKHVTEAMEVINILPTGKEIIKKSKKLIQSIEQ